MRAETIMILFALFLLMFWITAKLMLFTPESKLKNIRRFISATTIHIKQLNIADTINIYKTTHKYHSKNALAELTKPTYNVSDEEYIQSILLRKGLTTTTAVQSHESAIYTKPRTHAQVVVDERFQEILERKAKGESNSRIIREMFDVRGGDLYLKYLSAIKHYFGE